MVFVQATPMLLIDGMTREVAADIKSHRTDLGSEDESVQSVILVLFCID
jgi:hypothetical protein